MQVSGWKKWTLGVVGTIVLGALGSGLWDIALKPSFTWLGQAVLTAATLGSSAVKDLIYREAAKGPHETASLALISFLDFCLFYIVGLLGTFLTTEYMSRRYVRARSYATTDLDGLSLKDLPEQGGRDLTAALKAKIEELEKESRRRTKRSLRYRYVAAVALLFPISDQLVTDLKIREANSAYTFFRQSLAICRPYIDDKAAQLLQSRFAAVNGRADYINVIGDLRHIAASNRKELPAFKPW